MKLASAVMTHMRTVEKMTRFGNDSRGFHHTKGWDQHETAVVVVNICWDISFFGVKQYHKYLGLSPLPVTVTTRIITFLVGDPNLNLHLPQLLGGGTTQQIPHTRNPPKRTQEVPQTSCCNFPKPTGISGEMLRPPEYFISHVWQPGDQVRVLSG